MKLPNGAWEELYKILREDYDSLFEDYETVVKINIKLQKRIRELESDASFLGDA